MPSFSTSRIDWFLSSTRSTTFSPLMPGSDEKRRSTVRPCVATWMRPSCGMRRSAMSRLAITFSRETIAGCSSTRGVITS